MKYLQTTVVGCILVLAITLIPHIGESIYASIFGTVLFLIVLWIAYKTGEHFHHGHTHEGDSNLDTSIGITLIAVNIFHPMIDGFALYNTHVMQNKYVFISVTVGVVIHEIFRQIALAVVFKQFGFSVWKVVLPAFSGMCLGWVLGIGGNSLPSGIEPYIDAVTFAAYIFIVTEHLFAHKETIKKRSSVGALLVGVVLAIVFVTLFKAH